jgi:phosphoribosylaminoimidazole carboxylase
MWNSPRVGVLGGGQLGRMLMESANRHNIQMNILDVENAPAKQISAHASHVVGSFNDRESVHRLAKISDVLTTEIEHVNTYALEEVASEVQVEPSWRAIRIIQNKFEQKNYLSKHHIPMADYQELVDNTPEQLAKIGYLLGYPFMLKSQTLAYDGRGM